MDAVRLADLVAAKTRVRANGVEGTIVGFRTGRAGVTLRLLVGDVEQEVAATEVEELEPLDTQAAAEHWRAVAEADEAKIQERRLEAAKAHLAGLDENTLAALLADPAIAERLAASRRSTEHEHR